MFWLSFEASKTARPEEKNTAPIPTENHMFGPLSRIEKFVFYDLMEIAMYTIYIAMYMLLYAKGYRDICNHLSF